MSSLRLRIRLTLWFSASVLLILLPVIGVIASIQWQAMRGALDHHLTEDLEVAAQMLSPRDGTLIWRVDDETDPGYDAGPRRWVEVYGASGELRFVRGAPEAPDIRSALPGLADAPEEPFTTLTPAGAHVRLLTVRRVIGGQAYTIRVARGEDALRASHRRLLLILAVFGPMAVGLAAAVGYGISGRMLTPLATMAERARVISAERLDERLPVGNPDDELGQLATVFNETFERLQASFDRLRRFTADVSHELRTPLTAIRSVGEVGLGEARTIEDHQEVIGSMLEEADRLAHLVETLLTLSRWESGRVAARQDPVDLAGITRLVAGQLSVLADERNVALTVAPSAPLEAQGDEMMLRQAVGNVIDNAIKFTPPGRRVAITFVTTPDEHQIIVADEGPGIPADRRPEVVERFYRLDRDREQGTDGAGLGLSIVQWAVTAQGGRLERGDAPGGGTRVTIALPRS
jgi:heavy metal sensor kinase